MSKKNLINYGLVVLSTSSIIGSVVYDSISLAFVSALVNIALFFKGTGNFKKISLLLMTTGILSGIDINVNYNGEKLTYVGLTLKSLILLLFGYALYESEIKIEKKVDESIN